VSFSGTFLVVGYLFAELETIQQCPGSRRGGPFGAGIDDNEQLTFFMTFFLHDTI